MLKIDTLAHLYIFWLTELSTNMYTDLAFLVDSVEGF